MKKISNILIIALVSVFSLAIGASAATTIASSSVSYGDTTVKAAIDELIAKTIPLSSKVSIGDYVKMTPTKTSCVIPKTLTGYDSNQTINPSELNLWRVIDIKENGTIEMVSEYVSSTSVYFKGRQGYMNLVGTLNLLANQYANSNYTVASRYIGYTGQTEFITDTSKFTTTPPWASNTSDNSNDTLGGGDIMYTYDTNESTGLLYKALGTLVADNPSGIATSYWLGSRSYVYGSNNYYRWNGRNVLTSGLVNDYVLYRYEYSNDSSSYQLKETVGNASIRPIVTLRSNITSYKGSGTSTSPWVLS